MANLFKSNRNKRNGVLFFRIGSSLGPGGVHFGLSINILRKVGVKIWGCIFEGLGSGNSSSVKAPQTHSSSSLGPQGLPG